MKLIVQYYSHYSRIFNLLSETTMASVVYTL